MCEARLSSRNVKSARRALSAMAAAAAMLLSTAASADMIRPNTATATSTFNSSYSINHAISGAGLPAGFTPASEHATYTGGNHWTTASGRTIGESATFFFTTPTQVGGFYMWAHRSNNIASNPHYAVTRFDLVFRNAAGDTLATLTNLVGVPNVLVAQTYAFDIVENVSSVQFIVRATANNNSSPFTGLAEVAFDTCIPAAASSPASRIICPQGTVTLSSTLQGSGPRTPVWQVETGKQGSDTWIDLADGPMPKSVGGSATVSGATTGELTIAGADSAAARRYRLTFTNPCGNITTEPATLSLCTADFNCDAAANSQDFFDFLGAFFALDPTADFNDDTIINSQDFFDFLSDFFAGC